MQLSKTVVLIPAKNESATVGTVVETVIKETGWPVVVIDDDSTDKTCEVAQAAGATVLRLPQSVGAWRAIQSGFKYALAANYSSVITMDADGQHLPDTLRLLHSGLSSRFDVVIGSCPTRVCKKRKMSWLFFRKLTGLQIEDLTSGLRAYNYAAIKLLSSNKARSLEYQDIGVLMLLRSKGFQIKEIYVPMKSRLIGRSRIYHSQAAVASYLLKTTLLCLRKRSLVE